MTFRGLAFIAALAALLAFLPGFRAPQTPADSGRRVFVLHSGLHFVLSKPDKNAAAKNLRAHLLRRGIAERDIVVLDNPFPTASWVEVVPRAGLDMYVQSMDPGSRVAQDAYRRFDVALRRHGVTGGDRIVWVGHSAGGQMGMTLAHLAHSLTGYPELAKDARPYRFEMVVTLGTPVGSNHVPPEVKLRHYYSPADTVVGVMARNGSEVTAPLGYAVRFAPCCDLADHGKVRVFTGIQHPLWNRTDRVMDRVLAEFDGSRRPAWCDPAPEARAGFGLAQLLCRAVDDECGICFEDPGR